MLPEHSTLDPERYVNFLDTSYYELLTNVEKKKAENAKLRALVDQATAMMGSLRKENCRILDRIASYNQLDSSDSDFSIGGTSELSSAEEDFHGRSTKIIIRYVNPKKPQVPKQNSYAAATAVAPSSSASTVKKKAKPKKSTRKPPPPSSARATPAVESSRAPSVLSSRLGSEDPTSFAPPMTPTPSVSSLSASVSSSKRLPPKARRTHSKRKVPTVARRVPEYPLDPTTGGAKLPLQIGNITTVVSLGKIPANPELFHNDRYIWPVGYQVTRVFASMENPTATTNYLCSILEDEQTGAPLYRIQAEDRLHKPPVDASTASGAWSAVLKAANVVRNKQGLANSVSGPEYYGLSNSVIAKMIQDLPGADNCTEYVWQPFEVISPAPNGAFSAVSPNVMKFIQQVSAENSSRPPYNSPDSPSTRSDTTLTPAPSASSASASPSSSPSPSPASSRAASPSLHRSLPSPPAETSRSPDSPARNTVPLARPPLHSVSSGISNQLGDSNAKAAANGDGGKLKRSRDHENYDDDALPDRRSPPPFVPMRIDRSPSLDVDL